MAKPTHDEIIRELSREMGTLNERVSNLKEELHELKKSMEETSKKHWSLFPPALGAVVNVLLAALVAYLVSKR